MRFYDEAFKAAAIVTNAFNTGMLAGYPADGGMSLPWICNMAINAGAGDHLEIGTSYGASAIAVALAKKAAGIPGTVYCIDPYPKKRNPKFINSDAIPATYKEVLENIKKSEVDITIIRASSSPFPAELKDKLFVSSYIDGDHIGDMPMNDIRECAKRTEYYMGVDNYEEGYPDILNAVHKFALEDEWNLFFKNYLFVSFRKKQHPRASTIHSRLEHL